MGPKPKDSNGTLFHKNFIHKAVLNIDSPRVGARQIADQLFVGRRILERVIRDYVEKRLCLCLESCGC